MSDFLPCIVCEIPFPFGRIGKGGWYVPLWRAYICRDCDGRNWDGLPAEHYPGFVERLAARGVAPDRNRRGYVIVPPRTRAAGGAS